MPLSQPQARVLVDLDLRVWGMDADGRAFCQDARVRNVSARGALLSDMEHELKIGDIIGVQRGEKKARCKVVWAANTQSTRKIQVGVQLVSEECPWRTSLPNPEGAASITPSRRRWERHKMLLVITLHHQWSATPMRVTATDISASGCYVETISPFPIGTSLMVDLCFAGETIGIRTFVRSCDPGVGMGLEFIGLKPEDQQRFQAYLTAMDPWNCSIEHHR
jgi:PilZ domain-containing protein